MKLPKQLPAVDRNSSKTAVVPVGANVNPSGYSGYFDALSPYFSSLSAAL